MSAYDGYCRGCIPDGEFVPAAWFCDACGETYCPICVEAHREECDADE